MVAGWLAAVVGAWLMAAPAVLGYAAPALVNDRIVGPVAATVGVCSAWQVLRGLRWLNVVAGGWQLLAPFALGYAATAPTANGVATGLLLLALGLVKGRTDRPYGGGWRALTR